MTSTAAHAYIDPGTGVTFATGILAWVLGIIGIFFGAIALTFRKWSVWLKNIFGRKPKT
jgi:hypothetical protein